MPDTKTALIDLQQLREYVLGNDRHCRVVRELWNDGRFTYMDLRNYISSQKASARGMQPADEWATPATTPSPEAARQSAGRGQPPLAGSLGPGRPSTGRLTTGRSAALSEAGPSSMLLPQQSSAVQPTAGYTFVGMRCVFDDTKCAVVLVKFANVRSDLLAYADIEGRLWLVRDIQDPHAAPIKAPQVHRRPITSLDWSRDNTYLLTAGSDGLTVWDVAELCPVRTLATPNPANAFTAVIFHSLSANMVLAGTASGMLDVINASTGATTLSVPAAKKAVKGVSVTALECSAHHVFVGDSTGWLHLHKQDISRPGQLAHLMHQARVRVPASEASTPLIGVQYLAFCGATGSAALLVTARDSTVAIVKLVQEHGLQLHSLVGVAPMAREIRAWACPLSVLHCDLPRVVIGSEETGVHIYNLSAKKAPGMQQRGVAASMPAGYASSGAQLARPLLVNTLRGHRAPVAAVSWAFDESFLASADYDGMVIVWERATG